MKIGAHVSTAGCISNAVGRAKEIGCEAIQIFGSSPQTWAFKPVPGEQIELFKQSIADAGIGPVFLHAIYLINLGTPNEDSLKKGINSLIKYMDLAADIGAAGVIFHPGSHGGRGYDAVLPQTVDAIKTVLDASPYVPCLAVENMAGMGQHIGAKFDELGGILKAVDSPRLKICLGTPHAFAAGYDLTTSTVSKPCWTNSTQARGAPAWRRSTPTTPNVSAVQAWTGTITSVTGSSAKRNSPRSWVTRPS